MVITNRLVVLVMLLALSICGCDRAPEHLPQERPEGNVEETQLKELWITDAAEAVDADSRASRPLSPNDAIVANVRLSGDKKADLHVALFYLKTGAKVGEETRSVLPSPGPISLTFRPSPAWSAGRYLLEVKLNSKVVSHQEIEVVEIGKGA